MIDYIKLNEEYNNNPSKLQFEKRSGSLIISNRIFLVEIFKQSGLVIILDYRNTPFYKIDKISFNLSSSFEDNLKLFLENTNDYEDNSPFKFEETVKRFLKVNVFT